ncbi:hypothetical protein GGI04_002458 [Coemansia thaxteri]|uniref:GAF domain-containing protein n=1 Tax=Coemansia thaxteri TaxID=2663907 RepID=A0A9W8BH93_9FUNG|nr:hypothetical protein GGI04_002458 [Coemansia thaxteri]KAJ2005199.1 hypothetical protein H4R26_002086 [Coemansia thaxteri]KAJ2473618.1 hypothetical protein GGI02_000724 [Coemansia sp. RSA 2322]KAJ2487962.1 hypothetical protein EV174_000199 [Coemansia sp. RSA 2320]
MSSFIPGFNDTLNSKAQFYLELAGQCAALLQGQRNLVTNTANVSSLVYHSLLETPTREGKPVNWAGFYLLDPKQPGTLALGPFQGKPACTHIAFGKGVCGTAASTAESVVVKDVSEFPGHISCDAASKSEIVVPLKAPGSGAVQGVFDVDASVVDAFDDFDRIGLEAIVGMVAEASDF